MTITQPRRPMRRKKSVATTTTLNNSDRTEAIDQINHNTTTSRYKQPIATTAPAMKQALHEEATISGSEGKLLQQTNSREQQQLRQSAESNSRETEPFRIDGRSEDRAAAPTTKSQECASAQLRIKLQTTKATTKKVVGRIQTVESNNSSGNNNDVRIKSGSNVSNHQDRS